MQNKVFKDDYTDKTFSEFEFHTLADFGKDVYGNLVLTFKSPDGNVEDVTIRATPMGGINIKKGFV